MKTLMLGNEAVARGLYEAGCAVVSSYPGTPSTEITECAAKYDEIYCEWAPNEKVAMEVAFGACLAGKRSFCGMKHVGLNVAADPLFTMSYTGVNAGLVIAVADDAGMHSSQNEQDSRHHAIAAKVPMLEPSDSAEALSFAKLAYELSEQFDTPVILKMCTRVSHSQALVETGERTETAKPYEKNIAKYVMMPGNAIRRHPVVEERTRKLIEWAETAPINRVEMGGTQMGIITASTSYQYVKEVFGDSVSVLKLGMANCFFLLRSKADMPVLKQELDHQVQLLNAAGGKARFSIEEQPVDALGRMVKMGNLDASEDDMRHTLRLMCVILVLFLVVPSLNLAGLIVARMKKRAEEIGVRKAFGASVTDLMLQMLWENFVQTLLGGVVGLLLAYALFQLFN